MCLFCSNQGVSATFTHVCCLPVAPEVLLLLLLLLLQHGHDRSGLERIYVHCNHHEALFAHTS